MSAEDAEIPEEQPIPFAREDGRRADELREVRAELDYLDHPRGSCLIEMGRTRVLCAVSAEDRVPPHVIGTGRGWLTSEYAMLPASGEGRTPRERGRGSGRSLEIGRLIGRSLRAVVDLGAIPERTLVVDCDVIQADGGTRTAAITGAYLALARAAEALGREGKLKRPLLTGQVAAVSVGILGKTPVLDLDYAEDAAAAVDMNVVMTDGGALVEIQGSAEKRPFRKEELETLLALAEKGIHELLAIQRKALGTA